MDEFEEELFIFKQNQRHFISRYGFYPNHLTKADKHQHLQCVNEEKLKAKRKLFVEMVSSDEKTREEEREQMKKVKFIKVKRIK